MNLWMFVFFPMVMAFPAYFTEKKGERVAVATSVVSLGFAFLVALGPDVTVSLPLLTGLKLMVDGFRRVYILVICLMWTQTALLSPEYFRHHHHVGRYYFFNLLTLGATLGVFLAADLYTAFVFFEIMSFTSFTWVIQEETPGAIRAANTYLAVAVMGGLVALMGLFLLQHELGTTELTRLYELATACPHKTTLYLAGGCILCSSHGIAVAFSRTGGQRLFVGHAVGGANTRPYVQAFDDTVVGDALTVEIGAGRIVLVVQHTEQQMDGRHGIFAKVTRFEIGYAQQALAVHGKIDVDLGIAV